MAGLRTSRFEISSEPTSHPQARGPVKCDAVDPRNRRDTGGHLQLDARQGKAAGGSRPRVGSAALGNAAERASAEKTAGLPAAEHPPIRVLDVEQFGEAMESLIASLDGWKSPVSLRNFLDRANNVWNSRVDDVSTALIYVRPDAVNVVYELAGQPVGLMSVSRPVDPLSRLPQRYMEIHALATHPGTAGVGRTLVEHAVHLARKDGGNGSVRLSALPGAMRAYEAMGFRRLGRGVMELDPP